MSVPSPFSSGRENFTPSRRRVLALPLALLAVAGIAAATGPAARAQSRLLDGPRRDGSVGERYDGYAVLRDASKAATLGPLVNQVNAQRRQVYAQRAAADKVSIDQVGRVYAAEIFKAAPPGTWFLQENGQWVRK